MADLLVLLAVVASLGGSSVGLAWLAARVRRRGTGGGYSLMGPFDDIWNPALSALGWRSKSTTSVPRRRRRPVID